MIQGKLGVPTGELKLVFADQLLENGRTLSDYNIQDGATLYIGGVDVHIPLLLYCSLVPSPIQFFNVTVLVLSLLHIGWFCTCCKGHHKVAVVLMGKSFDLWAICLDECMYGC